ncbi:MAG: spore coat associated protein CotJA [Halothermotrichaceae bacterium]
MDADKQYVPRRGIGRTRLAHAYVPFQRYTENFPPEKALRKGTLFPELYMPYRPEVGRGYY